MKILIISVSAGAGHVRAAEALEKTAKINFPQHEIKHIDMMEYVSAPLRTSIVDTYKLLIKNAPDLWGFIYKKSDNIKKLGKLSSLINTINKINARKFYAFLEKYNPDHIICTHSFPAQTLRQAKNKSIANKPISLVVTDYGIHAYWLLKNIQYYFVATKKMKWEIEQAVAKTTDCHITGIPIDPVFFDIQKTNKYNKKHTILLMSGGQGMIQSDKISQYLLSQNFSQPIHIIAIAGKNKNLQEKLKDIQKKYTQTINSLETLGWTNKIHTYMNQADLIISKPGGITTSECIVLGKHMIAIDPIPGQEEHNAEYLLQTKQGHIAHSLLDLSYYIEESIQGNLPNQQQKTKNAGKEILTIILKNKR
jgi:processive 1,2-diacylglycerol beta-glucosyltransferase